MGSAAKRIIVKTLPFFLAFSLNSCFWMNNNFHPIKEGYVYRSAQMDESELEMTIKKYDIKTIINLRGKNEGQEWYDDEVGVCKRYSVEHYDIDFSASNLPKKNDVLEFFEILDTAEYPLLIHCQAGADRTSWGAVVYELQYEKKPLKEALKQITFRYGHLRGYDRTKAMDDFFKLYEEFGKGKDLRTWVEEDYDEIKYRDYFKPKAEEEQNNY